MPQTRKKRTRVIEDDDEEKEEEDDLLGESFFSSSKKAKRKKPKKFKFSLDTLIKQKKTKEEESSESEPELSEVEKEEKKFELESSDSDNDTINDMLKPFGDELYRDSPTEEMFGTPLRFPQRQLDVGNSTTKDNALLMNSLGKGKAYEKEFTNGGWLTNCVAYPLDTEIMKQMFHQLCFEWDEFTVMNASRVMNTFISENEAQFNVISGLYSRSQLAAKSTQEWIPTIKDILRVFTFYGCIIPFVEEVVPLTDRKSDPISLFPIFNFRMLVDLISSCFKYGTQQYLVEDTKLLIQLLCWFSLDDRTSEAVIEIERCISVLLCSFSEAQWKQCIPALCKMIANTDFIKNYQNYSRAALNLPISSQRGKELQSSLAIYFLHMFVEKTAPEDKLDGRIHVELVIDLVKEFHARSSSPDHSKLQAILHLVDLSINDMETIRDNQQHIKSLKELLIQLNSLIREVSGYNLLVTKVKDTLVLMTTKYQMLLQTSKSKPVQSKITF